MKLRLNIRQKGLILVAVPLAFGLLVIAALMFLLNQQQIEVSQEAQSEILVSNAHELMRSLRDAGTALSGYQLSHEKAFLDRSDVIVAQVPKQLSCLKELSAGGAYEKNFERIELLTQSSLQLLDQAKQGSLGDMTDPLVISSLHNLFGEMAATRKGLAYELEGLIASHAQHANLSAEQGKQRSLQLFMLGAVGLNVLLTVALANFFSIGITDRLAVLQSNASRLAEGKELASRMGGEDEVARLDAVFHGMAESLAAASQKERELMQLKQEFLNMASHDLRGPLTSIQASCELLAAGAYGDLAPEAQAEIASAERASYRLVRLINDLLDMDRLEAGQLPFAVVPVMTAAIINDSIEALQGVAEKKNIEFVQQGANLQVAGDRDRLVQVLVNILTNAIGFSAEGSNIIINVQPAEQYAEISVVDRAGGIPEEYKAKIFNRFQQVDLRGKKHHGGSGLGLAICKQIIEHHQGSIGVENTDDGSHFWFRVPLVTESTN